MATIPQLYRPSGIVILYHLETTVGGDEPTTYETSMGVDYAQDNANLFASVEANGRQLHNGLSPGLGGPDIETTTYLRITHQGHQAPISFKLRFFNVSTPETTLFEETLRLSSDGTPAEYSLSGLATLDEAVSSELIQVRCPAL